MSAPRVVIKGEFAVIGKAGRASRDSGVAWIKPLWHQAVASFAEVGHLALRRADGTPVGVWGAMNDLDESNQPWDERGGLYMPAFESPLDAEPPPGWMKWVIPAQTYLVVSCDTNDYHDVYARAAESLAGRIVGTIHEFYPDPGADRIDLYFPIAKGADPISPAHPPIDPQAGEACTPASVKEMSWPL
ncbi:MAG: GyrI-like domain-containing protein [Bifidobacteriaceae bacterium]|nr:GyrI-like domain-containing protein [Bifidobacteriaceae bacterium]